MNSKNYQYDFYSKDEIMYKHLYQIPPRIGRYIVLDTETTGLRKEDHIIELGACEILNGNLTGGQFHIFIRPRLIMDANIVKIHGIENKFYDNYYKDVYQNDKQNLLNFSKWVNKSIIFAHNAPFDMNIINKELYYWGLNEIPITRYRCSMRIFREIISKYDPLYDEKYTTLEKCCEYFGLKTNYKVFHNALFDSYMTARLIGKMYEKIDSDPELLKDFNYNEVSMDSHYFVYKKHKIENYNNNNYYCNFILTPRNIPLLNNNNNKVSKEAKSETAKNNNDNSKSGLNNKNVPEADNDNNKESKKNDKNKSDISSDILNEIFNDLSKEKVLKKKK